jgi:hypothetical protein
MFTFRFSPESTSQQITRTSYDERKPKERNYNVCGNVATGIQCRGQVNNCNGSDTIREWILHKYSRYGILLVRYTVGTVYCNIEMASLCCHVSISSNHNV